MSVIVLILAALPVFLIGLYIYTRDKNREPFSMLIRLFFSGLGSIVITLFITIWLSIFFPVLLEENVNLNYIELFYYSFFGIALVEETSKFVMTYLVSFKSKYFDEEYDMIVYSSFVALGFAFFENILYVIDGGIQIALLRAITAIPAHTCAGVMMGYYLSKAKMAYVYNKKDEYRKNILFSILIPTLLHGIYDYCAFASNTLFIILFIIVLIFMYILSIVKIKSLSKTIKKFRVNNFCSNYGNRVNNYKYCIYCGKKIE